MTCTCPTTAPLTRSPIVFLDTETCGLGLDDPIWEIALVRRETDGTETTHHFFVEHDTAAAEDLPDRYREDHDTRYDPETAYPVDQVATLLLYLLRPALDGERAHVVGCCPWFDMARISRQITDGAQPWHFHLIDVEAMAFAHLTVTEGRPPQVPWFSDDLFARLGLHVEVGQRHTAMYDAQLARAAYAAMTAPGHIHHTTHLTA